MSDLRDIFPGYEDFKKNGTTTKIPYLENVMRPSIEHGDTLIVEFKDLRVTTIASNPMDDCKPPSGRERMTWIMPLGKNKYELQLP